MCGIVAGTVAGRQIGEILLGGLRRLEYRGYDSAGLATLAEGGLHGLKVPGKVARLADALNRKPLPGSCGIAHTRWATHGPPNKVNAHPHFSAKRLALVHNGIVENHDKLRGELVAAGYEFISATDTEVVAHLIHRYLVAGDRLHTAVRRAAEQLEGSFALAVLDTEEPEQVVGVRGGSPLSVGLAEDGHFLTSDPWALRNETDRFIFLENGDSVVISPDSLRIYDRDGSEVQREPVIFEAREDQAELGAYKFYMLKEIFEQPDIARRQIDTGSESVELPRALENERAKELAAQVRMVHLVACGTSYHAALVARYWIEAMAGIPCAVEIASEYRYRQLAVLPGTLFVTISQSGETADTLAALRHAVGRGDYLAGVAICNVPNSSLARESQLLLPTLAGREIGVASTKAFLSQMISLLQLSLLLSRSNNSAGIAPQLAEIQQLPALLSEALQYSEAIAGLADTLSDSRSALFLGRGIHFPIAMEGALKLKEISYIHAEATAAGELKHGPLALVDDSMPVIALVPEDHLQDKIIANLEEVKARGGRIFAVCGQPHVLPARLQATVIPVPAAPPLLSPLVYTVPLQLLAYHVAVSRGLDVDQPRNLAKSVTVE